MSASVLKVPTKCERTAARRKIWRRWERAGLGPSRPQQTFERRQRGFQRAVALGQLATARGDDDLWADVIASATAAGGQRALVEAAAVIAKSAQRIPKRLFNLLTSRQARWHTLVVTALEHLAQWLDRGPSRGATCLGTVRRGRSKTLARSGRRRPIRSCRGVAGRA